MKLCLGDVRTRAHDPRPIRVLAFDEIEVLYDTWWETLGWGWRNARRNAAFGRTLTAMVVARPRLRVEPLTEKEMALLRPDLPLRLCRHRNLNWGDLEADSPDDLQRKLEARKISITPGPALSAARIEVFVQLGEFSERFARGTLLAEHGGEFSTHELLWKCQRFFRAQNLEADDGVGLYRSGVMGGHPSYWLGGFHDFAGFTRFEEEGIDPRKPQQWRICRRRADLIGDLKARMAAIRKQLPFKQWRQGAEESGLDQYSKENCAALTRIFDRLLKRLVTLGEGAAEADKLNAFRDAIEATNELNAGCLNLIETGEREQLCELCNEIATAVGLDPKKYGGGEGPASLWRDW